MPPEDNPADEVPADKESYEAWENRPKSVMVTIRCSVAQRTELNLRAARAKLSLNKYLLQQLLGE